MKEDAQHIARLIIRKRRLDKFLSTYYERNLENMYEDGCVRGYYHHNNTETGRLVSDAQQVPKSSISKIKRMFVSRYK